MPSIQPVFLVLNILIAFSITFCILNLTDMYVPGRISEETFKKVNTSYSEITRTTRTIKTEKTKFISSEETKQCCIYLGESVRLEKSIFFGQVKSYTLANENFANQYYPEHSTYNYFYLHYLTLLFSIVYFFVKHKEVKWRIGGLAIFFMIPNLFIWFL
ncbi:MAG: hypothetical protein ACK4ND_07580 [Cytophagaceae bacterium]